MSDTPILQAGDRIHILAGDDLSNGSREGVSAMYEARGIKVIGWTSASITGLRIISIIRGGDPEKPSGPQGPSWPRTR